MKILFGYMAYPFAIASYFRQALEKRHDVELWTTGAYTGDQIPWNGGMRLPMKYVKPVDLPLPPNFTKPSWSMIKDRLPWKPDLVICCDAGFHFADKPDVPYAVIGTDPHVLNDWYDEVRPKADLFFNMQRYYMKGGDIHLPYAFSSDHHYATSVSKEYDASLIGLHYQQRDSLVSALRHRGHKVLYDMGLIYDEYRTENSKAKIGLNWSSLMDINARIMETMAMNQILLTNRLPHMEELGLFENEHYLAFSEISEAIEKAEWALSHENEAKQIANLGYKKVNELHTYDIRINTILKTVGMI